MRRSIIATVIILAVTLSGLLATAGNKQPVIEANNSKGLTLGDVTPVKVQSQMQELTVEAETITMQVETPEPGLSSVTTTALGGGDNIATATVIPALPFSDTGHTTGFTDDYSEACVGVASNRPDVVYSYTPVETEIVDISLCNSSYTTNLWVYETDATTVVACNRLNSVTCTNPRSAIEGILMQTGVTYYIVIDGDFQIPPFEGNYAIEMTSVVATDSVRQHPAFGDDGGGILMLGYEYNNGLDSNIFWQNSIDDGGSFIGTVSWNLPGWANYPSIDYWGSNFSFYFTFVPSSADGTGGPTYRGTIGNGADNGTWSLSSWAWDSFGWHDMTMSDIACEDGEFFPLAPAQQRFGLISMVHSSTYPTPPDPDLVNAPHLFYETDSSSVGTISWYNDLNGCATTTIDIDKISHLSFATYDWWSVDSARWNLLVRRDQFGDPADLGGVAGLWTLYSNPGEHVQYPAVAAHNGDLLIAVEFSTDATPNDHDIIVYRDKSSNNNPDSLEAVVVVATPDDERYPRISHISGDNFVISYVANNQLFLTVTADGGITWDAPYLISGADYVVSEYRTADIADGGQKIVWEYMPGLPADSSIFLHFALTNVIQDTDGDWISDEVDNCPLIANRLQEDADADGIGDVCDDCTDTDSDGYGNPGFPANTCAVDNCPDVANPLQEDTNADGIGDACCCVDERGNVDGLVAAGLHVDVNDLTYLVAFLFQSGPDPVCPDEGNVDALVSANIPVDVNDLTYLVSFLFQSGPQPAPCL